jgi:hypothetical protein
MGVTRTSSSSSASTEEDWWEAEAAGGAGLMFRIPVGPCSIGTLVTSRIGGLVRHGTSRGDFLATPEIEMPSAMAVSGMVFKRVLFVAFPSLFLLFAVSSGLFERQ